MGKLKRFKQSTWMAVITPVLTFGTGLVAGKLLEKYLDSKLDSNTKVMLIGIFTVCVLSVALLLIVTVFARAAEQREKRWLQNVGERADLLFERGEDSKGLYFKRLVDFIEQADENDEILIMTQHRPIKPESLQEQKAFKNNKRDYTKRLLQRVRAGEIKYRRIMCFENFNETGVDMSCLKPWLVEHCREMLEVQKTRPDKIALRCYYRQIGADIFVIPRKLGAIVIDHYHPKTGAVITNASLFFHSPPNAHIIEELHSWFNDVEAKTFPVNHLPKVE